MAKKEGGLALGMHPGIHNDIYRAFDAVSYSDLKDWVAGTTFKPTPAMNIGTALHALILEPEDAKNQFWTAPSDVKRNTKDGKAQYAEWEAEHPGKVVLLPRERDEVKRLLHAVRENPLAMKIIEASGDNEVSVISRLPNHEILSKCRIDMVRKSLLADLKTTGAANQAEFESSISKFVYDGQGAYYSDQVAQLTNEHKRFAWICVSKKSLLCWVTLLQPQHYASGHRWYNDVLSLRERYGKQ